MSEHTTTTTERPAADFRHYAADQGVRVTDTMIMCALRNGEVWTRDEHKVWHRCGE